MAAPRGKYPDRDYSLKGLGMRVDTLEEHKDANADLIATLKRFVKITKIWAPIIATAAASGAIANKDLWTFMAQIVNAAQ